MGEIGDRVSALGDVFLNKARGELLAGAVSELDNGRYNNAANRCYYTCFQAAIVCARSGRYPASSATGEWSHAFVQAQFIGQLINRRKVYPVGLRDALTHTWHMRQMADYETEQVSRVQATRAVGRAHALVTAVVVQGEIAR